MDKILFKRILISIFIVCLVSYVIFIFARMNSSDAVDTENAEYTTVSDIIQTEGFVVRDESYIVDNTNGEISYNVNDGENISLGKNIADVYENYNDAVAQQEIKRINKQIDDLEKLSNSYFKESVGLDTVNNQIDNGIINMLSNVKDCNYDSVLTNSEQLLYFINERQIITGKVENFDEKINYLKGQKAELENTHSKKIKTITADKAGYFVSAVDGYENCINYNDISKVTLNDYNNIKKKSVDKNVIGKVVSNPEWFFVCKIDKDQALALSKMQGKGIDVNVTIPFISGAKIPASIVTVNQKTRQDDGVVVLSCDYMESEISKARFENIEIETLGYSGLKVNKKAIHEDYVTIIDDNGNETKSGKKVQGVYVLYGSELIFKEISIIHSTTEYVICNPEPDEGVLLNGETIQLYDQIVIKGDDLYNGKVIK